MFFVYVLLFIFPLSSSFDPFLTRIQNQTNKQKRRGNQINYRWGFGKLARKITRDWITFRWKCITDTAAIAYFIAEFSSDHCCYHWPQWTSFGSSSSSRWHHSRISRHLICLNDWQTQFLNRIFTDLPMYVSSNQDRALPFSLHYHSCSLLSFSQVIHLYLN